MDSENWKEIRVVQALSACAGAVAGGKLERG
jgi:hypothetical protein